MALNLHSRPKSAEDFYGNPIEMNQLPTPTTLLLEKRKEKVESPTWKGWTLTREHMTGSQAQSWIDTAIKTHLNGEPDSKRFTIELTLKEEST